MKKTLLASAIVAATFSGAIVAKEHKNMPTVYGNIQLAVTHTDVEETDSSIEHFDNGSTIGVKHSHEIAPGIEGFAKIELEGIKADNKDNRGDRAGLTELDEAYIGIKGDSFGQVWVGSDDSQYERLIDGIKQYYEVADKNIGADFSTGEGDLVQYVSPSFGGLTLHGVVAIQGEGDSQYAEKAFPYQLGAKYSVDMFTVAVAMDSNDGNKNGGSSENSYGVHVSADVSEQLTVGALYNQRGGVESVDNGQTLFGAYGQYSMGANLFALSYEMAEQDIGNDEATVLTLQALHNVSGNLYVYAEGYLRNDDNGTNDADTTELALGAAYSF